MGGRTERFGFSTLGPNDKLSDDGYKFTDADRRLMDRLLKISTEDHHHTGAVGTDHTPIAPPSLVLSSSGGGIPSGVRYHYKYTIVDGEGNESAPSPEAFVDTPLPLIEPTAPAPSYISGSGTLEPGTYVYVLSAYKIASALETKAIHSVTLSLPAGPATYTVSLALPALPAGADGFNVYRRSPTGVHFLWLGTSGAGTFTDDGSIDADCDRSLSPNNNSANTSKVTVVFPGATPVIPDGWSWNIYRTDDPTNWSNSYLTSLVPPNTPISYVDIGSATQVGAPPTYSQVINSPPKIQLTDAAEIQGFLPPGRNIVPKLVQFALPGLVVVGLSDFIWTCDYDQADILAVRANVGPGKVPAAQNDIIDVLAYRPGEATPTWQSIFLEVQADMAQISVGSMIGNPTGVPAIQHLTRGDALRVEVEQAGGGATPTDENLVVNIVMLVQTGSIATSYTFSSP